MKRWKKIGLGAALGLVAAVAGLGVWQRENVKALYTFLTNDSESISQTLHDKQQAQQDTLQKDYNITVLPPSIDMSNDLLDGKISAEEVKENLGIPQSKPTPDLGAPLEGELAAKPTEGGNPEPAPKPEPITPAEQLPEAPAPEPPQEPVMTEEERKQKLDELVNRCVAELYAREVDLMAQLGQMKQAAVDEWVALKPEERTTAKKQEIGFAGLEECYKLEAVVDKEVLAILDRYRPEVLELAGNDSVLTDLWRYYCDKKADQKAYYLDKYLD